MTNINWTHVLISLALSCVLTFFATSYYKDIERDSQYTPNSTLANLKYGEYKLNPYTGKNVFILYEKIDLTRPSDFEWLLRLLERIKFDQSSPRQKENLDKIIKDFQKCKNDK